MTTPEETPGLEKIKQSYKDAGLPREELDDLLALEDFGFDLDKVLDVEDDINNASYLKSKDKPVKWTKLQSGFLSAHFSDNPYPSPKEVNHLATELEVSVLRIKGFFRCRRKTLRRKLKKQGIPITSRNEMCLHALESAAEKALIKPYKDEDAKDDHIGHEASGGRYLDILCDIGMRFIKSY